MNQAFAESLMNLMIFLPLVGVPFILLSKTASARYIAFVASLVPLLLAIPVYLAYTHAAPLAEGSETGMVLKTIYRWFGMRAENGEWVSSYDIKFITGMDGLSIYLVLLNALLFPLTILFSWGSIDKHERSYYALLLVLEVGVTGFFMALDLVLFYVFFEMVLIPMYFLIGIWGGKERIYASVKFFLYTLVGSLLMLVAIIYLGYIAGGGVRFTSDYDLVLSTQLPMDIQRWMFLAFTISFAIKVPLFPLHTWLPDAHVQAPTAGSVILAGVLLKMGTYGLIRFCLPLFPDAALYYAPVMCALATIGIIYGGMAAMVQTDIKKLVAYSSVSHLGFIVLGIFSFTTEAMSGAVIQMINHGVSTGALFFLVGMIYDRRHSREIADFGGIARLLPVFTLFFMITVLSSVGLPGLNGFIGEFMVLIGSFDSTRVSGVWAVISAAGVIVAAVYLLWMFRRVMFGPVTHEENRKLTDLNGREVAVLMPLVILMFWMGLYAKPFLSEINRGTGKVLEMVTGVSAPTTPPVTENPVKLQDQH